MAPPHGSSFTKAVSGISSGCDFVESSVIGVHTSQIYQGLPGFSGNVVAHIPIRVSGQLITPMICQKYLPRLGRREQTCVCEVDHILLPFPLAFGIGHHLVQALISHVADGVYDPLPLQLGAGRPIA